MIPYVTDATEPLLTAACRVLHRPRSATIDAGMSVADSKVFLPASVEREDWDVKAGATGAPAQLARCGV